MTKCKFGLESNPYFNKNSVVYVKNSMSNFLSVEAYFAALRLRFQHKVKGLSQTAFCTFWRNLRCLH